MGIMAARGGIERVDDDRYHWYHRREREREGESNYGRGLNSSRAARGPEGVKSEIKGSCGRRRVVVAVKATVTRHVEDPATS